MDESKPLLRGRDDGQGMYQSYGNIMSTPPAYPALPSVPGYPDTTASYQQYIPSAPHASVLQAQPEMVSAGVPYLPRLGPAGGYLHPSSAGIAQPSEWKYGLLDCLADLPLCVLSCILPCLTFGRNVMVLDEGNTHCVIAALIWYVIQNATSCGCLYSCGYRRKLRTKYNLPEEPMPDYLVHCLCFPCAVIQEFQELRSRGLDPMYGWPPRGDGYGAPMAPPAHQAMGPGRY
ncbi:hypothetical protein CBR_g45935 [Chara braunii]|uniref:Uncharacterized protein n=1 Tax=Chara braunii TaxID=69332 RepID=A0A388LZY7_CHABU|nr:hypothetical protein CBR_g45935 [Chara braunii]|eukprot:GBG87779.1 hypothetical protein CBR_g45935 [Chara braunii]